MGAQAQERAMGSFKGCIGRVFSLVRSRAGFGIRFDVQERKRKWWFGSLACGGSFRAKRSPEGQMSVFSEGPALGVFLSSVSEAH